MKKLVAEFIGIYLLVLVGTGAIVINEQSGGAVTHLGVSLAFGLIVFAMIVVFGKISGAHINPAVSFGLWLDGRLKTKLLLPYIAVQLVGAFMASLTLGILFFTNQNLGSTLPSGSLAKSFLLEMLMTFVLVQAILLIDDNQKLRKHIAVIIGTVVFLEAFLGGPISGASMNPARSFGPALVSQNLTNLWIYFMAPALGAAIAAYANKFYNYRPKAVLNKMQKENA